jgi:hypothetical protein
MTRALPSERGANFDDNDDDEIDPDNTADDAFVAKSAPTGDGAGVFCGCGAKGTIATASASLGFTMPCT